MVTCASCKTLNDPGRADCQKCGRDLLPGEPFSSRLVYIGLGLFVALMLGATAWLLYSLASASVLARYGVPILLTAAVVFLGLAVYAAFYRTPLWQRYVLRARRHAASDADQAMADYAEALKTAPARERLAILEAHLEAADRACCSPVQIADLRELKQLYSDKALRANPAARAQLVPRQVALYEHLEEVLRRSGDERAALQTRLEYLGWIEEHIEDIISVRHGQPALPFGVTDDVTTRMPSSMDIQPRYFLVKQVKEERARMLEQGTIAAVGFCADCAQIYRLDASLECPDNPLHGRLSLVEYALPDEIHEAEDRLHHKVLDNAVLAQDEARAA